MKRTLILSLLTVAAAQPALTPTADALTAPGGYQMEVFVGGWSTPEYHARGKTYIEAVAGREYTIRLSNPTGRRVAVALTVDGLNTVDAKRTSAKEATKWVLAPYETVEIKGWQTSASASRAFYFTSEEASYGAWLGQTDNLGVISAAFFPEDVPEVTWWRDYEQEGGWWSSSADGAGTGAAQESIASAPAKPSRGRAEAKSSRQSAPTADAMAATGIGRQQRSHVTSVEMELEDRPAAVLSVRYEYRDALIKLGVLPNRQTDLQRREGASGFEDMEFAPDPWRPGW